MSRIKAETTAVTNQYPPLVASRPVLSPSFLPTIAPTMTVDLNVLDSLSLDEKILLTAGQDLWRTYASKDRNIPYMKLTDGPNGARGGGDFNDSVPAALFPSPSCLASTFDADKAYEMGKGIALDSLSKQCHVSLGPTINVTRDQRYGRAFENYGEDPLVQALTGAEWVRGLQSTGVAATAKHFVANEAEKDRRFSNSRVSEAAFREMYLEPFRRLFKEYAKAHKAGTDGEKAKPFAGQPACMMTSYNRAQGLNTGSDPKCAIDIARNEWGWNGMIMSDWFALHDDGMLGTDLEMPGPTIHRNVQAVKDLIKQGKITEQDVHDRAKKVLELVKKVEPLGLSYDQSKEHEGSVVDKDRNATIRNIASEGTVLLKNANGLLPLDEGIAAGTIKKIALIGVPWISPIQSGGGSANLTPQQAISPMETLRKSLDNLPNGVGKNVELVHHHGTDIHCFTTVPDEASGNLATLPKLEYLAGRQWPSENTSAKVLSTHTLQASCLKAADFDRGAPAEAEINGFAARVTYDLVAKTAGEHTITVTGLGDLRLRAHRANGDIAGQTDFSGETDVFEGFLNPFRYTQDVLVKMSAGEKLSISVEVLPAKIDGIVGPLAKAITFHVGFEEQVDRPGLIREAADLAASSDVAIVMGALGKDWETEGYDRPHLRLPRLQDDMIAAVGKAQKHSVLVNITGSAIEMPWLDSLAAVLQTWYGGQCQDEAVSDVLLGRGAAPASGRLCTSWPVSVKDQPGGASEDLFPGKDIGRGHPDVFYNEGRLVGYKWYEKKQIQPAFWFGSGLGGYASFDRQLESVEASQSKGHYTVKVKVTNTHAKRSGKDVVQVYVAFPRQLVDGIEDLPIKKVMNDGEKRQIIHPY